MLGLRSTLKWLAGGAAAAFMMLPSSARAQIDAGPSCAAIEQRAVETQRTLAVCQSEKQTLTSQKNACSDDLSQEKEKTAEAQAGQNSCIAQKDTLCTEAASFAKQIVSGKVTNIGTCVPGPVQIDLLQTLKGWEAATNAMSQLAAYGEGESDVLPYTNGTTTAERMASRLVSPSSREPLFFRRLVTEALKLSAPMSWQKIHDGGTLGIDTWFSSNAPLDEKIVDETQHKQTMSGRGQSLSAALRLVQSYQQVASCSDDKPTPACRRAHQLEQLFESTGPLLLRQRVEDVWSAECRDISPTTVLGWVQDFPTQQVAAPVANFAEVADAARAKLFTCYLATEEGIDTQFTVWLEQMMPSPKRLDARTLARVDDIRTLHASDALDLCAHAVRAMRSYKPSGVCAAPPPPIRAALEQWVSFAPAKGNDDVELKTCRDYTQLLWEGATASLSDSYAHPPSESEMLTVNGNAPESSFLRMRHACSERRGSVEQFPTDVAALAKIGSGFGEAPETPPWRLAPGTDVPIEAVHYAQASTYGAWTKHFFGPHKNACSALGLSDARCEACNGLAPGSFYDCDLNRALDARWTHHGRITIAAAAGIGALALGFLWAVRLRRARKRFSGWAHETQERLAALGFQVTRDPWRALFPGRYDVLTIHLPDEPAWERWGARAAVVRAQDSAKVTSGDINHAGEVGKREAAAIVFLLHDDSASLDLGAVRSMLDWASRGGTKAMHVLPLAVSRLTWANRPNDLLELVEETSLRGNPFEVRGRITTSSQFWNRERQISGILAEARAGHWLVVTGLRRFGKSSLALEAARRLPGPSAYVDLAGFHHEMAFVDDPSHAVNAVLRSLCERLGDSARGLYPHAEIPEAPKDEVDAAALARFIRDLSIACAPHADGRPPPMLLVLDELEQALAVGREKLGRVLDVLAILLGRMRNALSDVAHPEGRASVGVLLCSALHPLLWAPLRTLAQQSIMASFLPMTVPCMPAEAASAMMRGLGSRQGIRFTQEALDLIIEESQGVPLLLRRIGTSILELYDTERARSGALGAVQIGIEGAREALDREEREGSPVRVWVESEIAEATGPAGVMLRRLAQEDQVSVDTLRAIAGEHILAQFESSGIAERLTPSETKRRSEEAASVMIQMLGETGLLEPVGDLTSPEAYKLPEGSIRRVLRAALLRDATPPDKL